MRYPPTTDPLVIALRRLLEREGGHVAVGKRARINDQSLYQIASCRPDSKTGRPKSVGPSIRERLDKAYPNWLEASMGPGREIELIDNPDFPAIRRAHVRASAGITGFAIDYDAGDGDTAPIVFRRDWFEKHGYRPDRMIAMRVNGESMEPTLYDGDLIVVNMDSTTPKDGVAYLVLYEGEPVVKRLVRDAGAWWLASDNPDQRRYARKLCDDATRIVGEVVYRQSGRV